MKLKALAGWLPTVLLCILGAAAWSFSAIRFTGYVLFGIALVTALFRLLRRRKVLCRMLIVLLCIGVLAAAITEGFIIRAATGQPEGADCLIVLGAGVNGTTPSLSLKERLDAAHAYLQANPETVCIVSGGQGPGEDITEAECMYRYLTARGIAGERIIREDRSTSTAENLAFSKLLLPEGTRSIAVLSSEYHLFRAGLIARDQGLDPILVPAQTSWLALRVNYYLREIAAVWYYMIFGG